MPNSDHPDFNNFRPLDLHRWSDQPEVDLFIDEVLTAFSFKISNIRKEHLKALLLSLYFYWRDDPAICTTVHMDSNYYRPKSRYNELGLSKLMIRIIRELEIDGLIGLKRGFLDRQAGIGRLTRIWPTKKLIAYFKEASLDHCLVTSHPNRETIILKDKNKSQIEYADTPETLRMRSQLRAYNRLLEEAHITCSHVDEPFLVNSNGEKHWVGSCQPKHVFRVFNNSSFKEGGRFYGGWWMQIGSKNRSRIRINGQRCIEVDYVSQHIGLLYAKAGINYWDNSKRGDIYKVEAPSLETLPDEWKRKFVKDLILICLNTEDERQAFNAFRGQKFKALKKHVTKEGWKFPSCTNRLLSDVLQAFRDKHPQIANMLCKGVGGELQYMDSCIAERLIETFTAWQIPILTIHDSFMVQERHVGLLREVMWEAWSKETNFYNEEDFNLSTTEIKQLGYTDELRENNKVLHHKILREKANEYVSDFYKKDLKRYERDRIKKGLSYYRSLYD